MVDRLGWTLLHFLWEGAALAAILAVLLALTRRESVRYGLALGALTLLAASPVATFALLGAPAPAALAGTARATPGEAIVGGATPVAPLGLTPLVALWAVGVLLLSLRLVGTLLHLERWRRRHARPASPEEQARFDALARRLGLRRRIALFLSDRLEVPSAWGVLRPIVVLPASLMSGLPPAQVEGILLHELAHVRRYDYLVNLLQGVVETALFYHPAVWWVSSVVRRERERLCDDVAVAALGDPMPYARALLGLEERRRAPRPALSAKEGDLMNRIARVLAPQTAPARPSPLVPSLAALAVVGLALGGVLRAEAQAAKPTPKSSPTGLPKGEIERSRQLLNEVDRLSAELSKVQRRRMTRPLTPSQTRAQRELLRMLKAQLEEEKAQARGTRATQAGGPGHVVPAAPANPQGLRALPMVDVEAERLRAEAELRAARARLDGAQAARLDATGRIAANRSVSEKIAAARRRLEEARRAVERGSATYGAPGKPPHPTWKADDYPEGVARLAMPKDADTQAQDWAAMQRAQAELSRGLTARRSAVLAAQASANRAIVRADYEAARAQAADPDHRAALVAQAQVAQRAARAASEQASKDRAALLAQTATLQAQAQAVQRSAQEAADAARHIVTYVYDPITRRYVVVDPKTRRVRVQDQPPARRTLGGDWGGLVVNGDLTVSGTRIKGTVFDEEPEVAFENGRVSVDARDASFVSLVRSLARKAWLSVVIGKGVYADVSLVLTDRSPADALAVLCRAAGAELRSEGGVSYVSPRTLRNR